MPMPLCQHILHGVFFYLSKISFILLIKIFIYSTELALDNSEISVAPQNAHNLSPALLFSRNPPLLPAPEHIGPM